MEQYFLTDTDSNKNHRQKSVKPEVYSEYYQTCNMKLFCKKSWSVLFVKTLHYRCLTLNIAIPEHERKSTEIFIFTLLCGASEGFMKAL